MLTVVDPNCSVAAYCVHSYYIDTSTGTTRLLSRNDPFISYFPQVDTDGKKNVIEVVSVEDNQKRIYVEAFSYSIKDFKEAIKIASNGQREFVFYWCSAEKVKTGWWQQAGNRMCIVS